VGRPADAAQAYGEGLTRAGLERPDVRAQLGQALLRAGRLDEAEAAATRVAAALPAKALELRARVALARGRLDEARRLAVAAASSRNPPPASWLVGAEVRIAQGDYKGALARLAEARRRADAIGLAAVYNLEALRGDALARSGRLDEAEAAYRREVSAFPSHLRAYANLAALLFAQRRRADGLAALEAMVAANPVPRARQAAAVTLRAVGDRPGAARFASEPPR
jgi:protein O-GlcNAc transferase